MTDLPAIRRTPCDVCGQPATVLVSSSYAWGGNPAYGSYRSFRCDAHVADRVPPMAKVEPLYPPSQP